MLYRLRRHRATHLISPPLPAGVGSLEARAEVLDDPPPLRRVGWEEAGDGLELTGTTFSVAFPLALSGDAPPGASDAQSAALAALAALENAYRSAQDISLPQPPAVPTIRWGWPSVPW